MAWSIRSLAEASQAIRGAFRQHLPGTDTALKNNFVTIVAKVLAGMSQEFELRMGFVARQIFARTASLPFLILHGADVGIFRKPAAAARGIIEGSGEPNRVYSGGIRFLSGNITYVSTGPVQASSVGLVAFEVVAEEKGAFTNRDVGGVLTLSDPGLNPSLGNDFAVGSAGLGGGADVEDIEDLRSRILFRKANPPGAGKLSDYERIVRDVPGVLKAWAYRDGVSPSFLVVFFLFAGRPDRIPSDGDKVVVQAAVDASRMIRVNDSVAEAPTAVPLDPVIADLSTDSEDVRRRIADAIDAVLYERARPGVDSDVFWLSRSWIAEAISGAVGEDSHRLVWPADDLPYTGGRYPVIGTISYE